MFTHKKLHPKPPVTASLTRRRTVFQLSKLKMHVLSSSKSTILYLIG